MRRLVWYGDRALGLEPMPALEPADGAVVLDLLMAGICGSDLHGYRGHPGPRVPPLVLGHEAVGTVSGREGRFVPFPIAHCGTCRSCLAGREQLCVQRGLLGLDRPGVFADQVLVPESSLVAVPDGMTDTLAALTEPYAVAWSAVKQDAVGADSRVLVIGTGTIGALVVHAAKHLGAAVTAADTLAFRREIGATMGADEVVEDAGSLAGAGFDVAIDCVGLEVTAKAAVSAVTRGGRVALVGLAAETGDLPLAQLVREAITVRGHYAYSREDFKEAIGVLAEDAPNTDWLTYQDLADGPEAFRRLVDEPDKFAKVILKIGADGQG